ncbi:F-box domain-containing protein [Mycena sanguinolenta]|uniref:F-box domain-containing protein n=1 Tax=Mycena sanguinolenta TaxID=230812 RepID=A0A8H6Y5V4_9AGAR|nr:F-box domain-containing protein [Mycena sanguinolenta]
MACSMRAALLEQTERTQNSSKADVERFIEESELKISSLESQISALVELRDRERACVAALRHLFSPIRTLPVELLAVFFGLAIRSDTRLYVRDVLRISQVCSGWRQVAHSTPRLWARALQVDLGLGRGRHGEQVYVDGLKTWLQRSAPLTVPISLMLDDRISQYMVEEVLETAPRWRTLDLNAPANMPPSFSNRLADARLDNLEELDLTRIRLNEYAAPTPLPLFTAVPRLRKLRFRIYSDTFTNFVPWTQLTDVDLHSCSPDIVFDILSQCTNLVRANISVDGSPAKVGTIALNHLRVLTLRLIGGGRRVPPFLDHMLAPALRELRLVSAGAWSETSFTAFQLRAPNITQLDLQDSCLTSDDLRTAIRNAPSLTHLKISCCRYCINDTLIDALCNKAGVSPLAPHLHNLYLDYIGNKLTEDLLAGMIVSRWWTDAELESRLVPPAVSRWTRVQLYGSFSEQFINSLKDLPSDVLLIY